MTVSHLTTSEDVLLAGVISELATDGYPFNRLTTDLTAFFASVSNDLTGGSVSHLTQSENQILAGILNNLTGGSVYHLTSSRAEILAGILNEMQSSGPIGSSPFSLDFSVGQNSGYLVLLEDI